jgi:hypothetical protein
MAWTSPMTWTDNTVLCASQLNLHLRDNLLETMVAKTSATSTFMVANSRTSLVERTPGSAEVNTSETKSNTEYGDLDTVGPKIVRKSGPACFVMWGCHMTCQGDGNAEEAIGFASLQITNVSVGTEDDTGENAVLEPDDAHAVIRKGQDNGDPPSQVIQATHHLMLMDLGFEGDDDGGDSSIEERASEYEFCLKYRTSEGHEVAFHRRNIFVWPMS